MSVIKEKFNARARLNYSPNEISILPIWLRPKQTLNTLEENYSASEQPRPAGACGAQITRVILISTTFIKLKHFYNNTRCSLNDLSSGF